MSRLSFGLTLAAHAASVSVVRHVLGGLRDVWPVSESNLRDIQIAVSEACTNVVVHAYDGEAGMLEVKGDVHDEHVCLRVRDTGPGIDPDADPGLGFGMHLIRALADGLDVGQTGGAHEVTMRFAADGGAR